MEENKVDKRKRFGEEHHSYGKIHSEEYKKDLSEKMKLEKMLKL